MMKSAGGKRCRKCGEKIAIITWGIYRKAVVDEKPVMAKTDPRGETFLRIDGSKFIGIEVPFMHEGKAEPAYRPHKCGGGK